MQSTERDLKVINFNPQQFSEMIQKMNYINSPLSELAAAPSAIVYIGTPCCSIRCCVPISCCCNCVCDCADYYRYNTLINANGVQKFLFKNITKINCSICSTDKVSRFDSCKSFALSSYDQYSADDGGVLFSEMVKDSCCTCFGLYDMDFKVNIPNENRMAGIVKFRGCCSIWCSECCKSRGCCSCCKDCCYDYFYCCDILGPNAEQIYTIYLRKCCLSCIPTDCCGYFRFSIQNQSGSEVGFIEAYRNCCNLCGICGTSFTYSINFPPDASPELKLSIINGVIAIDLFRL